MAFDITRVFERLPTLKQRDLAQLLQHNWHAPAKADKTDLPPASVAATP